MQVGGPAHFFAEPNCEEELVELLDFARQENLPLVVIGKGSNVIFPDEGYPGLVFTLIHYELDRIRFDSEKLTLTASSGIHLYRLVLAARDQGLSGIEFLANVPGTLGGALIMNAGFCRFAGQRSEIGDLVEEVNVISMDGKKEAIRKEDLSFSYRHSNLDGKIVLSARLRLWHRHPEWIQREIRANFDYRNTRQDLRYPSSGSVFKNPSPPHPSAGKLINQLGLRGMRVGGAMVSERHGNYIVNTGQAKGADVVALIRQVQKAVLDATEIFLEPEVRIIERP